MSRTTYEPLKVIWLDTEPVDIAGPTTAEIVAGVNLTAEIPVDGVAFGGSANNASQAMLGDAYVAEDPGTWGRTLEITFMFDRDGVAQSWDTFAYRTEGWLLFSRKGALVDGTPVDVWHVKSHEKMPLASAENEYQKFSVQFAVQEAPTMSAVIGGESS